MGTGHAGVRTGVASMFKSSEIAERQVWREVVMDAVDLLLRQTDRRMKEDSKEAFASGNIGAVLIVDGEQEKLRDLQERLHSLRATRLPPRPVPSGARPRADKVPRQLRRAP
jgi:hypothetical protein